MDHIFQSCEVFNPENKNCPVCNSLNSIYKSSSFQNEMELPQQFGKGYCRRIVIKPSMEISICDMTFYQKMTMGGRHDSSMLWLAFCLGERFSWKLDMNKKELEMKRGESYMCNGYEVSGICSYNSGQRFLGLNVKLDIELLMSLINSTGKEYRIIEQFNKNNLLFKKKFTSSIGIILNDIIRCRYRHSLKRVYLEGKILELIAVYMDEMVNENGAGNSAVKLSSYDMEALYKAKMVLDEDIVSPPTLAGLARRVCLNEYKLKKGFKELFGIPVHAYVIDKRLEMARFLIEDKRLKVTEAALFVGYNDASHFAEKFKKKYGINPSEYIKSL